MLPSYTIVDFHLLYDGAINMQIWAPLTRSPCKTEGIKSTRNLTDSYPGSPLVTTMEKSTRNQSLGYELTHAFQWERSTSTLGKFLTIFRKKVGLYTRKLNMWKEVYKFFRQFQHKTYAVCNFNVFINIVLYDIICVYMYLGYSVYITEIILAE